MKVCPINSYSVNNYQNHNVKKQQTQNPNFKGWGGALGTLGGAIVGVGVTVLSGGALAWTIPAISGLSGIGGDIYEHSRKPSDDDNHNSNAYYTNHRD